MMLEIRSFIEHLLQTGNTSFTLKYNEKVYYCWRFI